MSILPKNADFYSREKQNSAFIPYTSQVTKNIIKLDSGDYVAVIQLAGAAHESADNRDLNSWHLQLNNFMKNIASPQVALWSHTVPQGVQRVSRRRIPRRLLQRAERSLSGRNEPANHAHQ
ncbi:hypothetical protein [Pseudomonas sp. JG-B]|uniref:hypothetical protein n=1 Tax=Pseudomonas sp. JG-B TaxID=2603214 RepID=UPI00129E570D|nr:hypothetical protein [Pseudomonas sp. JG-B]MRK19082.1 hypothetical protein [Pseudomonas sp. JG-B]